MEKPFILHMFTPEKNLSPFDVNMALDAGYDAVVPYTNVGLREVTGLVQDAIFSRPPKAGVNTAMFFGGKDAVLALDMLDAARKALVPPFGISFFADPSGSFTTAAAMVACVEKALREHAARDLKKLRLAVFGGTGVVGFAAAVIAAEQEAEVTLVGHDGAARVEKAAKEIESRFGVAVTAADGSDDKKKAAILAANDVVLSAARAGTQVLSRDQIAAAPHLLVVADVNAVPPPGIEGLEIMAKGDRISPDGPRGLGPLAIGNVKYQCEFQLFQQMLQAERPVAFELRDVFRRAREIAG